MVTRDTNYCALLMYNQCYIVCTIGNFRLEFHAFLFFKWLEFFNLLVVWIVGLTLYHPNPLCYTGLSPFSISFLVPLSLVGSETLQLLIFDTLERLS